MITWYEDKYLKIEFDIVPDTTETFPCPFYGKERNKEICEKPFLNRKNLNVTITYKGEVFSFLVPEGYTWDGATIPRIAWITVGSPTDPKFQIPSLIHDVLCENKHYINYNRYLSTLVLERLLYCSGVSSFKRWRMKHCVDNFQKFQGWGRK